MSKLFTTFSILLLVITNSFLLTSAVSAKEQDTIMSYFEAASNEYSVPQDLLLAVGYVNTHWKMPSEPSIDQGWGIMHLVKNPSKDTLNQASNLTGVSTSQLKTSARQNIRGGAALLAKLQGSSGSSDLNDWHSAVVRLGGPLYAAQVYSTLKTGAKRTLPSGETIVLPAHPDINSDYTNGTQTANRYTVSAASSSDYSDAHWVPAYSGNYTSANRPSSNPINKVVIHLTDGSYSSAIYWFQDPSSNVSAHYVTRSSDGDLTQMVHHKDIAWHAGYWPYNQTSIGIEHEGYEDDPSWFTDTMYRSSAKLVAYICAQYDIPADRDHIIGHSEVPDGNGGWGGVNHHTDPGPYWDWNQYMGYVRYYLSAYTGKDTAPPSRWIWSPENLRSDTSFPVTWGGNDGNGSGLDHYQLQWYNGSWWANWIGSTTSTRRWFGSGDNPENIRSNHTYAIRIRSVDKAGNASRWAFTYTTIDQRAPTAWVRSPEYSTQSSPNLNFLVTWGGNDGNGSGVDHYQVQWYKSRTGWVDWRGSTTAKSAWFGSGGDPTRVRPFRNFLIRVRSVDEVGRKSNWRRTLTTVPVDDPSLDYSAGWRVSNGYSSHYLKTLHYTSQSGRTVKYRFWGSKVAWISDKGLDKGRAEVWIDGNKVATVNLYGSGYRDRVVVFERRLGSRDGSHTIRIRTLGGRVDVDGLGVLR